MHILLILVVATIGGIALADSPPENKEPSKKKYLTAEEEAARWPGKVARDEMGPLMVQRGPGKVVYSFWNPEVEKRLFDRTFMIAEDMSSAICMIKRSWIKPGNFFCVTLSTKTSHGY